MDVNIIKTKQKLIDKESLTSKVIEVPFIFLITYFRYRFCIKLGFKKFLFMIAL